MKKLLLPVVMAVVLIPCTAQQTSQQRPGITPVPDCGLPMPAIITLQPQSQHICPGGTVTFTASAGIAQGLIWTMSADNGVTWQSTIPNAVFTAFDPNGGTDSLTVYNVTTQMNGYLFRCEYGSPCGPSSKTIPAVLYVEGNGTISIQVQPANITVCKNTAVDFNIGVTGSSVGYQWQVSTNGGTSFSDIPGNTASTLHFDSVSLGMNNNLYQCHITSGCGTGALSNAATLTVINETASLSNIFYNPVCGEDTAYLHVTATGNNLGYQWKSWDNYGHLIDLAGETTSTLSVPYYGYRPSNTFTCTLTSNCKTLSTNSVTIYYEQTAVPVPAEDKFACSGDIVTLYSFQNYLSLRSNPHFQWQYSSDGGAHFTDLINDTLDHLSVTATPPVNNYRYRCFLSSACFTGYSNVMTVHVNIPVAIITQPSDKKGCIGFPVTFNLAATGSTAYYHWEESSDGGNTFLPVSDNESPAYTIYNLSSSKNNHQYRCKIISNCFDTIVSATVTLSVYDNPEAGPDTCVTVTCDTCTADISLLHNTAGFASVQWGTNNPHAAKAGKYKLIVFNANECYDTAWSYVNALVMDTMRICMYGTAQFVASPNGSNYQWQVDWRYGQGFVNVSDDQFNYSGSNTAVFTFKRINNNVLVRCLINGNVVRTYNVQSTAYWTGIADSDWNNPLNWSCGQVPDNKTEVIIEGNAPHLPEIRTHVGCKKIIVRRASVSVKPGRVVNISNGN